MEMGQSQGVLLKTSNGVFNMALQKPVRTARAAKKKAGDRRLDVHCPHMFKFCGFALVDRPKSLVIMLCAALYGSIWEELGMYAWLRVADSRNVVFLGPTGFTEWRGLRGDLQ